MKGYTRPIIVKLQRPIFSSHGDAGVLMYDKTRKYTAEVPMNEKSVNQIFGNQLKVYWLARLPKKIGHVVLIKEVEEQSW